MEPVAASGTAAEPFGRFIGGRWVGRPRSIDVRNPFDGQQAATIAAGTAEDVRAAIAAAEAALALEFPLHARYDVLMRAAARIEAAQDEYAWAIAREGSKSIREARRVSSLDEAVDRANAVAYGLHAAIFTESRRDALTAVRRLAVGAVMINDSTDYRLDVRPFGGTKLSGIGREGDDDDVARLHLAAVRVGTGRAVAALGPFITLTLGLAFLLTIAPPVVRMPDPDM